MSSNTPLISERPLPDHWQLPDLPELLQKVYARRHVVSADQLDMQLKQLLPWSGLKGIHQAVECLLPVVTEQKSLLVVGDFDVDGASSTALSIRALRMMGATRLDYLVPNRFDFGYGLSPELVDVAAGRKPDLIMTVDNGIASVAGVERAKELGIPVLITDHHLPGDELPPAVAIVNPNQPHCTFDSKSACGCAVVFYLMLALRAKLQELGHFQSSPPNMASLLDLVALATVADVVPLDYNNRILVEQGLRRIRAGQVQPGIQALLHVAGKSAQRIVASDFGFALGPRLNAAGRLDDMSLGIECLLTDDADQAVRLAQQLDDMNRSRRDIEQGMQQEAMKYMEQMEWNEEQLPTGVCLYQPDWHQGVIGILASRMKDALHRPVIVFAADETNEGELKGSARSIKGLHIRDVLDQVHKLHPSLIKKFGGHAMAAGLTLNAGCYDAFCQAFNQCCERQLSAEQLHQSIETDGELGSQDYQVSIAQQLRWAGPWGQGFPEPLFHARFHLIQQRIVGQRHLKMVLQPVDGNDLIDAICFNIDDSRWPDTSVQKVHCVFQLDVNEYKGRESLQLMVRHIL